MSGSPNVIEVRHLSKMFSHERGLGQIIRGIPAEETFAVQDISFDVGESEVFGLVGPNGAGKTTLLRLLSTLLVPTSGTARISGADIINDSATVRAKIGLVTSNERSFFWRLSGRQNLRFFADLYHMPKQEGDRWISELFEMLDLVEVADQRFDSYSTGTKQRMAIARGLLSRPQVLFMDEPTKGVDPSSSQSLIRLIRERVVSRWRQTVIITTHNLREIEQLCDRTMIMDHGRMVYLGNVAELKRSVMGEEIYHLTLSNFPAEKIAELNKIEGIARPITPLLHQPGMNLEIRINRDSRAFPVLIKAILDQGGAIENCHNFEIPIEDAFVSFIENLPGRELKQENAPC